MLVVIVLRKQAHKPCCVVAEIAVKITRPAPNVLFYMKMREGEIFTLVNDGISTAQALQNGPQNGEFMADAFLASVFETFWVRSAIISG